MQADQLGLSPWRASGVRVREAEQRFSGRMSGDDSGARGRRVCHHVAWKTKAAGLQ